MNQFKSWSELSPDTKTDIVLNLSREIPYLAENWNPNTIIEWLDNEVNLNIPFRNDPVEGLYQQGFQTHGLSERNKEEI
jgi:hypothetical protein